MPRPSLPTRQRQANKEKNVSYAEVLSIRSSGRNTELIRVVVVFLALVVVVCVVVQCGGGGGDVDSLVEEWRR